jgi:hypothetical protein
MPENATHPASSEQPGLVLGEIVAIDGDRICVRLDSGVTGFVASSEEAKSDALRVGLRASFRVASTGADGSLALEFTTSQERSVPEQPFDREVVQLHNALANHHPANTVAPVERVHLGEEQIQKWIGCVESRLGRLRKNRAKRLNEEFYNGS